MAATTASWSLEQVQTCPDALFSLRSLAWFGMTTTTLRLITCYCNHLAGPDPIQQVQVTTMKASNCNRTSRCCKHDLELHPVLAMVQVEPASKHFLHSRHACSIQSALKGSVPRNILLHGCMTMTNHRILGFTNQTVCIFLQARQGCGGGASAAAYG